jgi:uncharacterized membrane protein YbhN (UPF0104 family)
LAVDEPAAADPLPDRRRLVLRLALCAGVLAALCVAVASLPGLGEVRARLLDAAPGWLVAVGALQIASCLAFVAAMRGVFCRRLPWRLSYEIGMAAQGTNVLLPSGGAGGLALAAWALRKTGMPTERLARRTVAFYLLTSSVNFMTAVIAGAALAVAGGAPLAWTAGPAAAAAVVIAAVLALPRLVRPRPGRAGRVLAALSAGIRDAVALARPGHPLILAGAIGFMVFDLAALGAAFAAIGSLPPIGVLALAYALGQLGGLVPLPGGVGGADGGLIAALVLYGTPLGTAAAAVLAYRAFQLGLPALLGALAVMRLPRVLERAPRVGALCEPPATAAAAPVPAAVAPVAPAVVPVGAAPVLVAAAPCVARSPAREARTASVTPRCLPRGPARAS